MSPSSPSPIKAVVFDYMGTCLDWHSSVTSALPALIPAATRSILALAWRQAYFLSNAARVEQGLAIEDFDLTLTRTLREVLATDERFSGLLTAHFGGIGDDDNGSKAQSAAIRRAVAAWHSQRAWPEVAGAVEALRAKGYEVYVHANGTTRLQLDITRSAGLRFDMLFSAELLGAYLPKPEPYEKFLRLVRLDAGQVVKVAAHVEDLRGAKAVGMKTIYIKRWTDDVDVDKEAVGKEFDMSLEDMTGLVEAVEKL